MSAVQHPKLQIFDNIIEILGKYSYVNAEGNTIEVKYSAGADIGFVVENEQELKGSVEKATNEAAKKVFIHQSMVW